MLKLVGSLCILSASIGMAYSIKRDMTAHLYLLYEIRKMLIDISYAANESMQPVEILLGCFVRSKDERLNVAFRNIAETLMEKREADGMHVWRNVFAGFREELGLRGEEAEILLSAGGAFFGKSVEENGKILSLTMERLDFVIEEIRKGQKDKQKVYQTVSVMSGLLLIILLI